MQDQKENLTDEERKEIRRCKRMMIRSKIAGKLSEVLLNVGEVALTTAVSIAVAKVLDKGGDGEKTKVIDDGSIKF